MTCKYSYTKNTSNNTGQIIEVRVKKLLGHYDPRLFFL